MVLTMAVFNDIGPAFLEIVAWISLILPFFK